ncbi:MAG: bifunctional serine/threonine-protein kinase/formylglycine-generating enzyme family protein [Chlamydiales bacterium]|nr:bifunctional serine/threonine-protein kinase/formylglycine-generating enzyme family protein [Chlamydiales bacterium]
MSVRVLGDYNIVKQLGVGTLGNAYLAEHRFMKRHFVLKVLPEELAADRGFIQRFEEEVKMLALLDHPNIVKIHNVSFANGVYFLVTDCIVDTVGETTNLAQYLKDRGRLPEDELEKLLRQIASALDYAHSRQKGESIHRGLKLSNILIGKGKSGSQAYLSDFGLSRIIGVGTILSRTYKVLADALGVVPLAFVGANKEERYNASPGEATKISMLHASFLQSYAFLAPEQKRIEDAQNVDAKADVYAFGVLAYYMITGKYPEGVFEMPSEKAPEYKLNWDILVLGCLQNSPEKRPPLLLEFMDECLRKDSHTENLVVETSSENIQEEKPTSNVLEAISIYQEETKSVAERIQERIRSESVVTQYRPEVREVRSIEPILTDMILVKGGEYFRGNNHGSRDEMPRHLVSISSFAIDIHPVTNEQFVRFLDVVGAEKDAQNHDIIRFRESRIRRVSGKLIIESGYAKHPVIGVTWYGSYAYAKWIGKRLPTEAEWEIASRGGIEDAIYPTGEEIEKSQANFFSSDTTAVMSYVPNGYGLYDMAGNVYEWCQDWYDYNYYEHSAQEPDEPKGPIQGVYRVLRGGCWKSLKEDLRCSHRHRNNPGTINRTYGFRCALDVT